MRAVTKLISGLLIALSFLGIAFATDGSGGVWHDVRDIFIAPPLWLLQSGFPALSPSLAIRPGSEYSWASFFMLFLVAFWWLVCAALLLLVRRPPPNNSFKVTPDGEPQLNR